MSGSLVPLDGAWDRVLGWDLDDLVEIPFIERVHPDDQEAVITAIHAAYAAEGPARFGCRYARKDGSYLRLNWEAVLRPGRIVLDLVGRPAA